MATWVDKIATAEKGNIPYGAIFLASIAQALAVVGAGAVGNKWPSLGKWSPTLVGGAGAVLVPQGKKFIGESGSKALSIGLGCTAVAPWVGLGLNTAIAGIKRKPVVAGAQTLATQRPAATQTVQVTANGLADAANLGVDSRE